MRKTLALVILGLGFIAVAAGFVGLLFHSSTLIVVTNLSGPGPNLSAVSLPATRQNMSKTAAAFDPAFLTQQLRSDNADLRLAAINRIRSLSISDPKTLAINLSDWLEPLLDNKDYKDVEDLAILSIQNRAFDTAMVQAAQKALVTALIDESKYDEALKAAKSYYNVAPLFNTTDAIDLITQILSKTDPAAAVRFRAEQIADAAVKISSATINADAPPEQGGILKTITVNDESYTELLRSLAARSSGVGVHSGTNLIAQGNLLLLTDQAAEAKGVFELSCRSKDNNSKRLREAVEGVARAIRAMDGNVTAANAFIQAIRNNPAAASADLMSAGVPKLEDLVVAATKTKLAVVAMMALPPLERQRQEVEEQSGGADSQIQISSGFECSTPIEVKQISPTHFLVNVKSDFPDWFMFRVRGAAGKAVRIDLTSENVRLDKWWSLNPVYTYAGDLSDAATYSSDLERQALTTTAAWNGPILPSNDDQQWHYIPDVWMADAGVLSFVQRFGADNVTVAMRVPYTVSYNEQYLHELTANPLAKVIEVGKSRQGRPLLAVNISEGAKEEVNRKPCILVYAREHADEHDGSWVAAGVIEFLLRGDSEARKIRHDLNFIVIPVLDPDASAAGKHIGIIASFITGHATTESMEYANWFEKLVDAGTRLDLVINLHNVQSSELPHVACALMEQHGNRGTLATALHQELMHELQLQTFSVAPAPLAFGFSPDRLGGWLSAHYATMTFAYEVNSQNQSRHLAISELECIGEGFATGMARFLSTTDGSNLIADIDSYRRQRPARQPASLSPMSQNANDMPVGSLLIDQSDRQ